MKKNKFLSGSFIIMVLMQTGLMVNSISIFAQNNTKTSIDKYEDGILKSFASIYDPAIEKMENVDFLLSPIFIVKNALLLNRRSDLGIEFKAILKISNPRPMILFTHNWVTDTSYRIEIQWVEPHFQPINYSYYPVSLRIISDEAIFDIYNYIRKKEFSYKKPVGERPPFSYAFDNYPIGDMRYADTEEWRNYYVLRNIIYGSNKSEQIIHDDRSSDIKAEYQNSHITTITTYNKHNTPYRRDILHYNTDNNLEELKYCDSVIYERGLEANNDIFTVKINNKAKNYDKINIRYLAGNRISNIYYGAYNLSGNKASLPNMAKIYVAKNQNISQQIEFFDYKAISQNEGNHIIYNKDAYYCDYSRDEYLIRALLEKYWLKDIDAIENNDKITLINLKKNFSSKENPGDLSQVKLKRNYMLMMVEMIIDSRDEALISFEKYLNLLTEIKCNEMFLFGAREYIDLAVRWHKYDLANKATLLWLANIKNNIDVPLLIEFAEKEINDEQYCIAYNVINTISDVKGNSYKFDSCYLKCVALKDFIRQSPKSYEALSNRGIYIDGFFKLPKDKLVEVLRQEKRNAINAFDALKRINAVKPREARMKKVIDDIM